MSVVEIYQGTIKCLPAAERLQLATMILNEIPPECMVDYSTEWSDEDMRDASRYSLARAAASMGEEDEDVA